MLLTVIWILTKNIFVYILYQEKILVDRAQLYKGRIMLSSG